MSTSQYFPMVDGARYDYMYTTGPWHVHGGDAFRAELGGVSGLGPCMHTPMSAMPSHLRARCDRLLPPWTRRHALLIVRHRRQHHGNQFP